MLRSAVLVVVETDPPGGVHAAVLLRIHAADTWSPTDRLVAVLPGPAPRGHAAKPHPARTVPAASVSNNLLPNCVARGNLCWL